MPRVSIGPPVWETSSNFPFPLWRQPTGSMGMLDTRINSQRVNGPVPLGLCFFFHPNGTSFGADYTLLGQAPNPGNISLSVAQRTAIRSAFSLPNPLSGTTVADVLWEMFTVQSDPTGDSGCKPLDCLDSGRRMELVVAGNVLRAQRLNRSDPEAVPLLDLKKRIYRSVRQDCLDGKLPLRLYRRMLGSWVRKYEFPYRDFQPNDLPDEPPDDPTTTISDNFNRANAGSLGSSSEGWSWTEVTGTWGIESNQALKSVTAATYEVARADSDLSSADHYSQVLISGGTSLDVHGPCCRMPSSASATGYIFGTFNLDIYLSKIEAGTVTALINTAYTFATGETYKVESNGTTIKGYVNGAEVLSSTDTAITGNLRCGMVSYGVAVVGMLDDFLASDLAAGGGFKSAWARRSNILIGGGIY